ncbi:MAG: nucleotidyltransferase domain-containing protein [Candidatus Thermoplasmatota archaeon]
MNAVQRLRGRLAARVPLDLVVLFGSRARSEERPLSDVDLLVVSPAFEGKSLGERAAPLYEAWDLNLPVDFLCYTPAEFARERARVSIVQVALHEGRDMTGLA